MKKGIIIVIDALDGAGKETQKNKLYERLTNEGRVVRQLSFPNYESDSSALVKMYLNGDFGEDPNSVSPYVASVFYAVDRFATYKKSDFINWYENGDIILLDRYTSSNMIHQTCKMESMDEKKNFLDWLYDFEFRLLGIPEPSEVIFLDMPPEYSAKLIKNRENKFSHSEKKDIHERNLEYLKDAYKNACEIADMYNWKKISCVENENIRTIDDIGEDIYDVVKKLI